MNQKPHWRCELKARQQWEDKQIPESILDQAQEFMQLRLTSLETVRHAREQIKIFKEAIERNPLYLTILKGLQSCKQKTLALRVTAQDFFTHRVQKLKRHRKKSTDFSHYTDITNMSWHAFNYHLLQGYKWVFRMAESVSKSKTTVYGKTKQKVKQVNLLSVLQLRFVTEIQLTMFYIWK